VNRRTLLIGLGACSGAGGALYVSEKARGRLAARGVAPLGDRSIYALGSHWTADDGRSVELASLAGRVQLLAMMFTSCPSVCPTFVREIVALDRALPERLRERTHVVFVSIDPENDTVEALGRYRKKMGLERERYTLLRGAPEDVRELAQVVGVAYAKTEGSDIAHTRLVTVLDTRGEVVHQQTGVSEDQPRLIAGIARAGGVGAG
jgi:protein SCO1/2